jgi:hypothetical protein
MSRRNGKGTTGRTMAVIAATLFLAVLTVAGIRLGTGRIAGKAAADPHAAATSRVLVGDTAAASSVTRTSGVSTIESDASGSDVNLRNCPTIPPEGAGNGDGDPCGWPIDQLASGNTVQMRCWTDDYKPFGYNSSRWFYVNEVNGPHPGWSGYVFSAEIPVSDQILTPACTGQIISQYMDPPASAPTPPLEFRVSGSCTTAGGTLSSVSSNFTPGATFLVQATYPDGDSYPLANDEGTVQADGSVTWTWPCAGDPAGIYSTTLVDESDGDQFGPVYFTIDPAPSASAASPPATGVMPGTGQPPSPSPSQSFPAPAQSSPAPTQTFPAPAQSSPAPAPSSPAPATYTEQEWHTGANTFTDPNNASGMGQKIAPGQYVQVTCKLYDPSIGSASPGGYWYLIASSPWDNQYYAVANTFLNGDPWGGPYTHPTDLGVPNC